MIGSGMVRDSVPFGPLTVTVRPSMVTSTPVGTGTGSFPMRDIDAAIELMKSGECGKVTLAPA